MATVKKSKEEIEKALKDLQISPDDLDAVMRKPKCDTCYSKYSAALNQMDEVVIDPVG